MGFLAKKSRLWPLLLLLSTWAFSQSRNQPATVDSQTILGNAWNHLGDPDVKTYYSGFGSALVVSVLNDEGKHLGSQAVVSIRRSGDAGGYWRTTDEASQARFPNLIEGTYSVEVAAAGFLTEQRAWAPTGGTNTYRLEVTLRPDLTSVDLNAALGTRMSPKARKATERALRALKSLDYKRAERELDHAYKLEPSSSDVNGLLGYLYVQQGNRQRAVPFLEAAIQNDSRDVRSMVLLGRLRIEESDFPKAIATLSQAVAIDGDFWLARYSLAQAYLGGHDFGRAEHQAQFAVRSNKGGSRLSTLVLGQALAGLQRYPEAISALKEYLQTSPKDAARPQVEEFLSNLEARLAHPEQATIPLALLPGTVTSPTLSSETDDLRMSLNNWLPPGVDDNKPQTAPGVACSVDEVLQQAGVRVQQLVTAVSKFAAIEDLKHETVDELGHPLSRDTRRYDYVVDISEPSPGVLSATEYRMIGSSPAEFPGQIVTQGLPAMALVLHPAIQNTFEFQCEGLGQWRGQATWLVHFRQRPNKPNRIRAYRVGTNMYPVDLKGRIWISADNFQIHRVESELVKPLPEIQLLSEHQTVEYGAVPFPQQKAELWLPKNVELYADFRRQRYVRHHTFDHFMLFSVDSFDKQGKPKAPTETPGLATPALSAQPPGN
ncbi:MAG TPA: tetratricopeptide repeat protein [Terriglobales bacterium]|nr:tetratricopeptide repeat protein [Terriglobales bacterium]